MKILVVDDSGFMRSAVKKMLSEDAPFDFFEANNEDDAILMYKEHFPELVFLDVMMTRGDGGLIALKAIKETNPGAKVVIVTALDPDNSMVQEALSLGAAGVIKKPFSKEQLLEYV